MPSRIEYSLSMDYSPVDLFINKHILAQKSTKKTWSMYLTKFVSVYATGHLVEDHSYASGECDRKTVFSDEKQLHTFLGLTEAGKGLFSPSYCYSREYS